MDTNYAMAKFRMESKDILRSKQKDCWYYLKYFFFFSSIIQFLIIIGLVLFMLYGNAHLGTELRLKSVENRYHNLTVEFNGLNNQLSYFKIKLAHEEKQRKNCTELLNFRTRQLTNRSIIMSKMPPPPDSCRTTKNSLDQFNLTCTHERLSALQYKILKEKEFDNLKDNCTKTISLLTTQEHSASSEKENIQKQKTDLESQLKQLQNGCTSINEKFEIELEHMRRNLDIALNNLNAHDPYQNVRCKALSDTIKNSIDQAIYRLRQDVNNVMLENSQVKVNNVRIKEDLKQCNQDKEVVSREKNRLTSEKGGLEKQLAEKNNELNKSFSQYLKKEEELENCRKVSYNRNTGFIG
ncbi:plasmalemma vesicle-associated protein [Mixophyes fleayi]|uniref:plasmalemma vesicle-associated protein n=1 Tax=Mixophyes fleayi TaxID=3061075 RepID=UPI003F4D7ED7